MQTKILATDEIKFERVEINKEVLKSVKEIGIINPIDVRLIKKNFTSFPEYECLDGRMRLSVAEKLNIREIPCFIHSMTDAEVTEWLLMKPVHSVKIDKKTYQKHLKIIVDTYGLELTAIKLNRSKRWLKKVLKSNGTKSNE